ncbi:Smr/MutS family protein, partial [Candidatus Bipolaricaulota bacterium]
QEGAALGLSIIEALIESDALVGISTHLTPLKYFAIRHPQIKTAAMEFDLQTLSPTYRVIEGIPGRSNAFIIAQRLGLSEERIERARSFLSQGEIRAEDILDELERERQAMRRHRENAEQDRVLAKRAREEYEGKLASFEQERVSALSERFKALDRFLRDGQHRVEEVLAAAKAEAAADETRAGLHDIAELRQALGERRQEIPLRSDQATLSPDALEAGQLVHVRSVAADGRIVHVGPQGKVAVDLDGVRVTTRTEDLAPPTGQRKAPPSAKKRRARVRPSRSGQVPLQLNVRGMTVSEALRDIDDYLDRLLLADVRRGSILHGKGTGALRDAVQAYLASCSFVASHGFAPPNQGGDGVTEFEFESSETQV